MHCRFEAFVVSDLGWAIQSLLNGRRRPRLEASGFTAMTSTPFIDSAFREPGHRAPDHGQAAKALVACRLQHQEHHSQSAHRRVTLPPFTVAGTLGMRIVRHTAQFGSKGFVS